MISKDLKESMDKLNDEMSRTIDEIDAKRYRNLRDNLYDFDLWTDIVSLQEDYELDELMDKYMTVRERGYA